MVSDHSSGSAVADLTVVDIVSPARTAVAGWAQPAVPGGPDSRHDREVTTRLRKASGQVAGVLAMYEDGRYCIDVLDQLSAVRAALDAVALLILEDHMHTCVRHAVERGDAEEKVDELATAVRRYVRSR
jgi:DNA-binding FrmR family transcriptional regulator